MHLVAIACFLRRRRRKVSGTPHGSHRSKHLAERSIGGPCDSGRLEYGRAQIVLPNTHHKAVHCIVTCCCRTVSRDPFGGDTSNAARVSARKLLSLCGVRSLSRCSNRLSKNGLAAFCTEEQAQTVTQGTVESNIRGTRGRLAVVRSRYLWR